MSQLYLHAVAIDPVRAHKKASVCLEVFMLVDPSFLLLIPVPEGLDINQDSINKLMLNVSNQVLWGAHFASLILLFHDVEQPITIILGVSSNMKEYTCINSNLLLHKVMEHLQHHMI